MAGSAFCKRPLEAVKLDANADGKPNSSEADGNATVSGAPSAIDALFIDGRR